MKLFRINTVVAPGGRTLLSKDILAGNDEQAVARAADDDDCPICEVFRAGEKVGTIRDADDGE